MNPIALARRLAAAAIFLIAVPLAACDEASITDPEIGSGGQEIVLDFERFQADVAPIFTQRGCDNLACHGGGIRGTFQLSPTSAKDFAYDFEQASLQVDPLDRASSALLLKPLSEIAGGLPHAGDGPTTTMGSENDPDYATLRSWIEEGALR